MSEPDAQQAESAGGGAAPEPLASGKPHRRRYVVVEQDGGNLEVSEHVIANIVKKELDCVDGVNVIEDSLWGQLRSLLSSRYVPRSIRMRRIGNDLLIDARVSVSFGADLPTKARELRDQVKESVEAMTGCRVAQMNVIIDCMSFVEQPASGLTDASADSGGVAGGIEPPDESGTERE